MFEILHKSLVTGIVTRPFPPEPQASAAGFGRGRPEIDYGNWKDARIASAACPTGALACSETNGNREVVLDLGKCTFCGLCADVDAAITMSRKCELATRQRAQLITKAVYELEADGIQKRLLEVSGGAVPGARTFLSAAMSKAQTDPGHVPGAAASSRVAADWKVRAPGTGLEPLGAELKAAVHKTLGRSLHIREVDAGSCNGCEVEIVGLNSPIYDIERFGIHFVASPRHADMLLVTGPVSRNMELALRKTYDATPDPRLVVAVGACGCSGGIFGQNYATVGGVDKVIPVDVYVPGCPPNPQALLRGILTAIGRL
jgi:Ni,Fe-hydrogenase III small subunit/formate hydrogenlyase subunit 6/NADH:ubiquinone oxidoreductase subunit I